MIQQTEELEKQISYLTRKFLVIKCANLQVEVECISKDVDVGLINHVKNVKEKGEGI